MEPSTMIAYAGFDLHGLDDRHAIYQGTLPDDLRFDAEAFAALWDLHPADCHPITMYGRAVRTPRYQQAYGADYRYSGNVNRAEPVPPALEPILRWARSAIHERLNGILVNWYDGSLGHYMGPHHDRTGDMVDGAPIVTVSLGEERTFRLSHPGTRAVCDFPAWDGTVFILPYATNLAWKHGIPRSSRCQGRRIAVTIRAFEKGVRDDGRT